jgi:hypothetical protein
MFRKPALAVLLALLALAALPSGGSASVTNTRITSGPTGTVSTDTATFTFTSPEGGGFQCRLDDSEWGGCSSPKTYDGLADGTHVFEVRALNKAGHPDPTPSTRSFTVETFVPDPPETTLVSGPTGTIATDSAIFGFESDQPGSFECRLDSDEESAWVACESPQPYFGLAEGAHVFEARAVNESGEPDATPAGAGFEIEIPSLPVSEPAVVAAAAVVGPPKPVAGQTFNVEPVEGTIELQCPGEDQSSRLTSFKQIPMGCLVNTRHGTIALTSSKGSSGDLQDADFWGGVFVVTQKEGDDQEVELKLAGKRMCEKRSTARKSGVARASGAKRGGRRAWGSGKGNYETSGSYGSATVRGTTWLVVDRCDASTLIRVAEGTVWARDFLRDKTVVLTEGEQYVAKAPIPRLNPDKFP